MSEEAKKHEPVEFPKWIEPHASHIKDSIGGPVTPLFSQSSSDRTTRRVTVLVEDEEAEKIALAPFVEPGRKAPEEKH